jgi:hypothetical protein
MLKCQNTDKQLSCIQVKGNWFELGVWKLGIELVYGHRKGCNKLRQIVKGLNYLMVELVVELNSMW